MEEKKETEKKTESSQRNKATSPQPRATESPAEGNPAPHVNPPRPTPTPASIIPVAWAPPPRCLPVACGARARARGGTPRQRSHQTLPRASLAVSPPRRASPGAGHGRAQPQEPGTYVRHRRGVGGVRARDATRLLVLFLVWIFAYGARGVWLSVR